MDLVGPAEARVRFKLETMLTDARRKIEELTRENEELDRVIARKQAELAGRSNPPTTLSTPTNQEHQTQRGRQNEL